jgi:hypothetical protein
MSDAITGEGNVQDESIALREPQNKEVLKKKKNRKRNSLA